MTSNLLRHAGPETRRGENPAALKVLVTGSEDSSTLDFCFFKTHPRHLPQGRGSVKTQRDAAVLVRGKTIPAFDITDKRVFGRS